MGRPSTKPKCEIAAAIIQLRNMLRETQFQFAVRVGITPATLAKYETSQRPPGEYILRRIHAIALQFDPDAAKILEPQQRLPVTTGTAWDLTLGY